MGLIVCCLLFLCIYMITNSVAASRLSLAKGNRKIVNDRQAKSNFSILIFPVNDRPQNLITGSSSILIRVTTILSVYFLLLIVSRVLSLFFCCTGFCSLLLWSQINRIHNTYSHQYWSRKKVSGDD